eukprot:m.85500 g.85500  ORF g.85500 m.85500 type:complete len:182 (-) comp14847_c0_seq1:51-596(-)
MKQHRNMSYSVIDTIARPVTAGDLVVPAQKRDEPTLVLLRKRSGKEFSEKLGYVIHSGEFKSKPMGASITAFNSWSTSPTWIKTWPTLSASKRRSTPKAPKKTSQDRDREERKRNRDKARNEANARAESQLDEQEIRERERQRRQEMDEEAGEWFQDSDGAGDDEEEMEIDADEDEEEIEF